MNPKNPQSTPRAPQERPKATQEHPKSTQRAQNGPKGVLKMSPKVSQNDPEPVPKKDQKMRSYWPPKSAETIYIRFGAFFRNLSEQEREARYMCGNSKNVLARLKRALKVT